MLFRSRDRKQERGKEKERPREVGLNPSLIPMIHSKHAKPDGWEAITGAGLICLSRPPSYDLSRPGAKTHKADPDGSSFWNYVLTQTERAASMDPEACDCANEGRFLEGGSLVIWSYPE